MVEDGGSLLSRRPMSLASPTLRRALSQRSWVRIEVTHEALDDFEAHPFKGALWRSNLGFRLKQADNDAFAALFDLPPERAQAEPTWNLAPPISAETHIPRGTLIESAVTLHGPNERFGGAIVSAFEAFEQQGLGYGGRFARLRLVDAQLRTLNESVPWGAKSPPVRAIDVLDAAVSEPMMNSRQPVRVEFATPVRVKDESRPVHGLPEFHLLVRRIMGRVKMLAPMELGPLWEPGEQASWLDPARQVSMPLHLAGPFGEPNQFSARQRATRPLVGYAGTAVYGEGACLALPWLRIGEWIQVGGKTHDGFGVISVSPT